jgi:RNA polymerase sigma-70 factor (ECF subfamily)
MRDGEFALGRSTPRVEPREGDLTRGSDRLRALVEEHYDFVWRSLRRLGVLPGDVDDAAQQVLLVLSRKLPSVRPGSERRFLFQTVLRVAADQRRSRRRRRELPGGLDAIEPPAPAADAFDLLALRRARERLDRILDEMPLDLRAVFVLFELDEMTMAEIAALTGLRPGTVASRLRRAREIFSASVRAEAPRGPGDGGRQ